MMIMLRHTLLSSFTLPFLSFSQNRAFATLSSSFGSELFHGPKIANPGVKLLELPKQNRQKAPTAQLSYMKYPKEISQIKPRYFFKKNGTTNGHFQRFYHMTMKNHNICVIGSTQQKQLKDKRVLDEIQTRSRGYAIQLVLEGRGKRAYFDPEYPHLFCRFSAKAIDFTNALIRVADSVRVCLNKTGNVITIFGYNKNKVRKLAERIYQKGECHAYSMRGLHYAGFPIRQRPRVSKK